jgi:probable phosphoglycerate mutase
MGIVQGSRVNTSLNEMGIRQSEAFFNFYKDVKFDRIYTSKLNRSIESVQKFIDLGIQWESHLGLNEISWGDKDGMKVTVSENKYYHEVIRRWAEGEVDLKIEGGDSPLDVAKRQQEVVDLLKSRTDEENVLICMHGRAIRIILCLLTGTELRFMDRFEHENLCLYLLEYNDNEGFKLLKRNDVEHLTVVDEHLRSKK